MVDAPTLVVAVKANCDGCRGFLHESLDELSDVDVVVVATDDLHHPDFDGAVRDLFAAEELLVALDVRWPPFYVLLAADPPRVVVEGVAFTPAQVAEEISSHL